jgi:hypothetical protein
MDSTDSACHMAPRGMCESVLPETHKKAVRQLTPPSEVMSARPRDVGV